MAVEAKSSILLSAEWGLENILKIIIRGLEQMGEGWKPEHMNIAKNSLRRIKNHELSIKSKVMKTIFIV